MLAYSAQDLLELLKKMEHDGAPLCEMPIDFEFKDDTITGPFAVSWTMHDAVSPDGPEQEHYLIITAAGK